MHVHGWAGLAIVVVFVGCTATSPESGGMAPPASTRTTDGFGCPAGPTWRIEPSVCAGVLGGSHAQLGEPVIARQGRDHIVIAAVANTTSTPDVTDGILPDVPGTDPSPTPCAGFEVCVFSTRDGGATWMNASLPTARQYYDPQVLFAKGGRLVVATLAYGADGSTRIDVTSTTDDGMTWRPTVTASTGDSVDRPWLRARSDGSLALLYVAAGGREVRGATSLDQGASWGPGGAVTCRWPSPPVELEPDGWAFLCSQQHEGNLVTRLLHWDAAAGAFEQRAPMPWSRWFPVLVKDADGSLLAFTSHEAVDGSVSITMRRTSDEGRTWSEPVDLRKASSDLFRLQYSCIMAASHDGDVARVIVAGIEGKSEQGQLCLPRETRRHIYALDVEPASGAVLAVRLLGSPNHAPPVRSSDAPPVNDDFHSIADGLMAWSHDGIVAWTQLPSTA